MRYAEGKGLGQERRECKDILPEDPTKVAAASRRRDNFFGDGASRAGTALPPYGAASPILVPTRDSGIVEFPRGAIQQRERAC